MIEAVVFDLDGILIDSEHVWDEVRQQLADERGGRWNENASRDMMGMSSIEWSRYMRDVVGLTEELEEISAEVVRRLVEVAPDLAPEGNVRALPTLGRHATGPLVPCPACGASMEPVFLGGLDIDRCYRDELVWLDTGELDRILGIAGEQRDARHPPWLLRIVRALVG